jgi:hypothetical protein
MGELLAATDRAKGTAGLGRPTKGGNRALPPKNDPEPTLADLGITKRESAEAKMLSELDALGLDLEAIERPKAKERQRIRKGKQPGAKSGKLPELSGDTRDAVGAAVGLSGKSYERGRRTPAAASR